MKLIVESGATKTCWVALSSEREPARVKTDGINLATMGSDVTESIVLKAVNTFRGIGIRDNIEEVFFYSAGLVDEMESKVPELAMDLDNVLRRLFPISKIEYASDLLSAARALWGHNQGIVAILGTGSNSCYFDGKRIVKSVPSGGFILGDEGSGARLGKLFISDFIKGLVPEPVAAEFAGNFNVDYPTVVKNVYRSEVPSKYLGHFAPWILGKYKTSHYVKSLVDNNFRDFCLKYLRQYDLDSFPVGVVGGFGYANRAILEHVAGECGIKISTIISTPMERLVDYHLGLL